MSSVKICAIEIVKKVFFLIFFSIILSRVAVGFCSGKNILSPHLWLDLRCLKHAVLSDNQSTSLPLAMMFDLWVFSPQALGSCGRESSGMLCTAIDAFCQELDQCLIRIKSKLFQLLSYFSLTWCNNSNGVHNYSMSAAVNTACFTMTIVISM